MALEFNAVEPSTVTFNGVEVRQIYYNGNLVWVRYDGVFEFDTIYYIQLGSGAVEFNRATQETPTYFYISSNDSGETPQITGNSENPSGDPKNWFTANNEVYGMELSWNRRTGTGSSFQDILRFYTYSLTSFPLASLNDPDKAASVRVYKDDVLIIDSNTSELQDLGFEMSQNGPSSRYPLTSSLTPNVPYQYYGWLFEYRGPVGADGDATVLTWLDALLETGAVYTPADIRVEIGIQNALTHTVTGLDDVGTNKGFFGATGGITPDTVTSTSGLWDLEILDCYVDEVTETFHFTVNTEAALGLNLSIKLDNGYELSLGGGSIYNLTRTRWSTSDTTLIDGFLNGTGDIRVFLSGIPSGTRQARAGLWGVENGTAGLGILGYNSNVAVPFGSLTDSTRTAGGSTLFFASLQITNGGPPELTTRVEYSNPAVESQMPEVIWLHIPNFSNDRIAMSRVASDSGATLYAASSQTALRTYLEGEVGNNIVYSFEDFYLV